MGPDPIIADLLDAAARDDRAALVQHWIEDGRTNVFARLAAEPPPDPPASYELRDGQIYRWTER